MLGECREVRAEKQAYRDQWAHAERAVRKVRLAHKVIPALISPLMLPDA
jgi:hypothetical protein